MNGVPSSLTVTFEITSRDLRAMQRHAMRVMPVYRRARWINMALSAILAFMAVFQSSRHDLGAKAVTFLILFPGIWGLLTLINVVVNHLLLMARPGQKGVAGILCEHTISIDPVGLTESTTVNESRCFWQGVYRIDTTADHIFIYIQANQAHVIPRGAFPSNDEADRFFQTASFHHSQATSGSTLTHSLK